MTNYMRGLLYNDYSRVQSTIPYFKPKKHRRRNRTEIRLNKTTRPKKHKIKSPRAPEEKDCTENNPNLVNIESTDAKPSDQGPLASEPVT